MHNMQAENEDVPLAVRRRRSSEDEAASSALPLPLPRPNTHLTKPPRPHTSAKSAGQHQAAANKSATARQAPGKQAAAADANSKQAAVQEGIATKQGVWQRQDQLVAAKQGSARQDAGKLVSTQQGLVPQHTGKQVTARQGIVESGNKSLPASLPLTTAASQSQGSGSSASLSAARSSARTDAARLDAPAVSSSTLAQAVPTVKELMGPPAARKRPLLPDHSTLQPKKRRASAVAAPGNVKQHDTLPLSTPGRASALGPDAALAPAVAAQSKHSGKQVSFGAALLYNY